MNEWTITAAPTRQLAATAARSGDDKRHEFGGTGLDAGQARKDAERHARVPLGRNGAIIASRPA